MMSTATLGGFSRRNGNVSPLLLSHIVAPYGVLLAYALLANHPSHSSLNKFTSGPRNSGSGVTGASITQSSGVRRGSLTTCSTNSYLQYAAPKRSYVWIVTIAAYFVTSESDLPELQIEIGFRCLA
ncbi:hypothetical protein M8818_002330 [Zalaria obscura]|uniref:Uncharacterized protein n=1 Tax=Zalaria obscura TaxID=2024903 RepID=A0ACC3SHH1_9PEZI